MKYFLMSMRFNKQAPSDFGLKYDNGRFISLADGSEWQICQLYDYGWGKENGFYKKPLGKFDELIYIVLSYGDVEDAYGAAAMIEQLYAKELKDYLLASIETTISLKDKIKLAKIFKLSEVNNRTIEMCMDQTRISQELKDWQKISEFYTTKNKSISQLVRKRV